MEKKNGPVTIHAIRVPEMRREQVFEKVTKNLKTVTKRVNLKIREAQ